MLYLHDGQNVFDAAAAGAEWQVDETAQRLVEAGAVQPMIIVAVAVASTGVRLDDYTPVPGRMGSLLSAPTAGGGAAAYGRYLAEELKPLIDARYRTRPGREHTALGGSSLGGLVSMWLLLQQPQVWGAALVVSPSVWWGGGMIVSAVDQAPASLPAPRLWIDVGGREGWHMVHGARRLRDAAQARGWPVAFLEVPEAGHDEASWAARVEAMLRFLHPR
jgi:predicted alpha/beta superfamily hydrolase